MSGISSANAPDLDLPARFLVGGVLMLGVLGVLAPWTMPLLLGSFATPTVLAFVHLNTVGVIGAIIVGASYQLTPVVVETPLAWVGLARFSFWCYWPGAAGLIVGLFTHAIPLLVGGATLLGLAFSCYIVVLAVTLWRAPRRDLVVWHFVVALGNLSVALTLGVLLAVNKATGLLGDYTLTFLGGHIALMLSGWVLVLLAGVAYRLVGMFTLAEDALWHPGAWAALVLLAGAPWLLFLSWLIGSWWLRLVGALALAVGLVLFAAQLLRFYRRRRRRNFDIHIPFALTAGGCGLLIASLLPLVASEALPLGEPAWIVVVWLALAGVAETAIQGFFYKIATFLTWLHRYAPLAGRQRVPRLEALYHLRLGVTGWALWTTGVLLAAVAILAASVPLSQVAGLAQLGGVLCFLANVLSIARHWWVPVATPPLTVQRG